MKIKKKYIGFYLQTTMEAIIKKIQKKVNRLKKEKGNISDVDFFFQDINSKVVDEFVDPLTDAEVEKILYKYGFGKALHLYTDIVGFDINNIDSNYRMKSILSTVLMESMIEK
jgi:hypothetical protein